MRLVNGMGRPVPFTLLAIKKEASQNGMTSFVEATCDDGATVNISQHSSGIWDIAVDETPVDEFSPDESAIAVKEFMRLVNLYNVMAKGV